MNFAEIGMLASYMLYAFDKKSHSIGLAAGVIVYTFMR